MPASHRTRQLLPIVFLVGVLVLAAVLVLAVARVRVPVPGGGPDPGAAWPSSGQAAVSRRDGELSVSSMRQRPVPVASLTKIMTALVVLDRTALGVGDEGATLTITAADVLDTARRQARSESVVALTAGDRLTERQALLAVLVPSAGNLAHVLAVRTAGGDRAFVELMNARARGLGMSSTRYVDVSGFDPGSRSTARDQTVLARAALDNPTFAWLVAQHEVVLPGAGVVTTTNRLLGHRGFVGVKTGSTTPAGGCYVFAAHREIGGRPRLVVGAVLGQRGADPLGAAFSAAEQLVDSATDPMA